MLDIIEDILPCGSDQWEKVSADLYDADWTAGRDAASCKLKFDRLWQQQKPTGCAEIPLHVSRALDIKQLISKEETIGDAGLNSISNNEEIEILRSNGTPPGTKSSTRLVDDAGMIRPSTRKTKSSNIADAIAGLGNSMESSSQTMASAIAGLANNQNNSIKNLQSKVVLMETKLNKIIELLQNKK